MNTYESSQRILRPVFGAIAAVATVATLGLTVAAPVALSKSANEAQVARAAVRPTEVAILPGTIQVVAKRTKVARADSPYLPASYNVR